MILKKQFEEWRFLFLLIAVLFSLGIDHSIFGKSEGLVFEIFYSLMLLAAVHALIKRKRSRGLIMVLGAITLTASWGSLAFPDSWPRSTTVFHHIVGISFMIVIVCTTVREVLRSQRITLDNVFGCIAGYLLLGTAWGMLYSMLHVLSPDSFQMSEQFPQFMDHRSDHLEVFNYYSFVVLTTLGFGDISPVTQLARTFTWLEAVSGQLYIATLVAGIVGVVAAQSLRQKVDNTLSSRMRGTDRADDSPPKEPN